MPYRDIGKIVERAIKNGEMKDAKNELNHGHNAELIAIDGKLVWCTAWGENVLNREEIVATVFADDVEWESRCYA